MTSAATPPQSVEQTKITALVTPGVSEKVGARVGVIGAGDGAIGAGVG